MIANWATIALPDCWLVGGAVAQAVWNFRFGLPPGHGMVDVDLVYFDAADLTTAGEARHAARIADSLALPLPLDVKNQARVHLWYGSRFGRPIPAYGSVEQAIATFPTTATAVGIRPGDGGTFDIVAPYGLSDLLMPVVRPNRAQITEDIYDRKRARWRVAWPRLPMFDWADA